MLSTFFLHAASLHHAFAHCARFSTAASRRSLGSVSVPMWLTILSDQLIVVGMVSRYLTIYLIDREPLPAPLARSFIVRCLTMALARITTPFGELSGTWGQVIHVLLTRSPLSPTRRLDIARLACLIHAASVRPEPGSNSPLKNVYLGQSRSFNRL